MLSTMGMQNQWDIILSFTANIIPPPPPWCLGLHNLPCDENCLKRGRCNATWHWVLRSSSLEKQSSEEDKWGGHPWQRVMKKFLSWNGYHSFRKRLYSWQVPVWSKWLNSYQLQKANKMFYVFQDKSSPTQVKKIKSKSCLKTSLVPNERSTSKHVAYNLSGS